MKKLLLYLLFAGFAFTTVSCTDILEDYAYGEDYGEPEEPIEEPRQETSIMPASYAGRPVEDQGDITVASKDVVFYVWDDGFEVDGDIVTIVVNGRQVLSNYTLTGSKKSINVTLDNKGYNYVLLYAHNEGTSSPNTCAISIKDSNGEKKIGLSARLTSNAAMDIIVQ